MNGRDFSVERFFEQGDTNKVFLTEKGTVVKEFSKLSAPAVTISIACLFSGHPRFFTRENRMKSEEKIREKEFEGLKFPELISSGKDFMEFEFIEGTSLKEKALNPQEAGEVGKTLGKVLEAGEQEDVFLVDFFLDNFIETEKGLYHIDPEFSGFTDSSANRLMDLLSVLLTLKLLPSECYREALEGFESVYGSVSFFEMFLANFVTLVYVSALGTREEFSNFVSNFKQ